MSDLNKTTYLPEEMAEEIRGLKQSISSSSFAYSADDVLFYDYDGTVLHSYSASNFLTLEQMPENPAHEGLISQGWNWSLDEAKEYVEKHRQLDIGQMYITGDGKTRLYLNIDSDNFAFYIHLTALGNKRVIVNWGDGNEESFSSGGKNLFHDYAHSGEYIVTMANDDSEPYSYSFSFPIRTVKFAASDVLGIYEAHIVAPNAIHKIELGERVYLNDMMHVPDVFSSYLHSLETITMPRWSGNQSFWVGGGILCDAYRLKHLTVPAGFNFIPQAIVKDCYSLQSISIPNGVIDIVSSSFVECYSLKRLTLPDTVEDLVEGRHLRQPVFSGCGSLESFTFPDNYVGRELASYEFYNCSSLSKLDLPNSIEKIGDYAFSMCTALKSITLPSSLYQIGAFAFQNCYALKDINIPNGVTFLPEYVFDNCKSLSTVIIPITLITISDYAFRSCESLTYIDLPETLSKIGEGSFLHCHTLSRVSLSSQITSIGTDAFAACYSLNEINIPGTLEELGEGAFESSGLKAIHISGSVKCVPDHCFRSCFRLKSVSLETGIKELGFYAFADCKSLSTVDLPDTISKCKYGTFENCTSLSSVVLPKRLNDIPTMMFGGCSSLKNVVLPKGLVRISDYAFQNCTSLESIDFPKRLEVIFSYAFSNCIGLKEIRFHSIEPPWIDNSAGPDSVFENLPSTCVIYVPRGTRNSYVTAERYPSSQIYEYVEYDDEDEEPDLDTSIFDNYLIVDGTGVDVYNSNLVLDSDLAIVNNGMLVIS